jgi:hypothetical protein
MEDYIMQKQKTRQDKYINYLNKNILPKIDFKRLQASYDGDKKYAKEVLCDLHNAVEKCYGTSSFDYGSCQDSEGFITIPGIVRGRNTGKIAVVLFKTADNSKVGSDLTKQNIKPPRQKQAQFRKFQNRKKIKKYN